MNSFANGKRAHLKLGRRGENVACRFLQSKGYEILCRNYRTRSGELDIVARDGAILVFVEVKTLRKSGMFRPSDNLSLRQCKRNLHAARIFYRAVNSPKLARRYDLIEIVLNRWSCREIVHTLNYLPQER